MDYFTRTKILRINSFDKDTAPKSDIVVLGWVRTKRDMKNFSFVEVNDGSTLSNLQVIVDHDKNFPIDKRNSRRFTRKRFAIVFGYNSIKAIEISLLFNFAIILRIY